MYLPQTCKNELLCYYCQLTVVLAEKKPRGLHQMDHEGVSVYLYLSVLVCICVLDLCVCISVCVRVCVCV